MSRAAFSLAVGLLASFVALTIGVAYGAVTGYAGGRVDALMMRIVEIVYALPFIFFVIVLVMVFGRHFALIFVTIGAVEWLDMARIVRGQTLSIKQRDFVAAAEALGASAPSILWRHVIPNASVPSLPISPCSFRGFILLESFVSFLGLGVQEPLTSWGVLVADGARNIQGSVHLLIFPALFLGATLGALQSLRQRVGRRDAVMETCAPPLLQVRDLRVSYGPAAVVKGVNFTLRRGETAAIVGQSGSGKTQTVLAALKLLPRHAVTTGSVIFEDNELLALSRRRLDALLGRRIAMVFQEPMSSLDPLFTVGAQIGAILRLKAGFSRRAAKARAQELLDLAGITEPGRRLRAYPHELSGGPAPARRHCDGDCLQPRSLDRRRTHDGSRRDGRCKNPRTSR